MPRYSIDSPDFWEEIASPSMKWQNAMAAGADMNVASVILGDTEDGSAPMVSICRMPPGGVIPRQSHDYHRFELLLRGELEVDGGEVLTPGHVTITSPNPLYGPYVAGASGAIIVKMIPTSTIDLNWQDTDDPAVREQMDRALAGRERWESSQKA